MGAGRGRGCLHLDSRLHHAVLGRCCSRGRCWANAYKARNGWRSHWLPVACWQFSTRANQAVRYRGNCCGWRAACCGPSARSWSNECTRDAARPVVADHVADGIRRHFPAPRRLPARRAAGGMEHALHYRHPRIASAPRRRGAAGPGIGPGSRAADTAAGAPASGFSLAAATSRHRRRRLASPFGPPIEHRYRM